MSQRTVLFHSYDIHQENYIKLSTWNSSPLKPMKKSDSSACTGKNKNFLLISDLIRLFCELTETLGNACS